MDMLQVFVLSLIQGVTEFLPVSSSAHLIVISDIFSWKNSGLSFSVALHLGSLIAICYYLKHDLYLLFAGLVRFYKVLPCVDLFWLTCFCVSSFPIFLERT